MMYRMNFTVQFVVSDIRFDEEFTSRGLEDLDYVRKKYNSKIPIDKIFHIGAQFSSVPTIELTNEENIRKIDDFKNSNKVIQVTISNNLFKKYVYKELVDYRDHETNELISIIIKYNLDKEKLIHDWIEKGAPKIWTDDNPSTNSSQSHGILKEIIDKIKKLFVR